MTPALELSNYMRASAVSAISLFLTLVAATALFAAGPAVPEITAAIDKADTPAEVAAQVPLLEAITKVKDAPAGAFVQLARADYLVGEDLKDGKVKLAWMDRSLWASSRAMAMSPESAPALYWRSMALLQKADVVGGISALGMVKEALKNFGVVAERDACYDSAGAWRTHGRVLLEAPGWAFLGDKKKGVALLEKAKALAPACLLNRLYLAQAYAVTGRPREARAEISYIIAAPADKLKPTDDEKVKEDARKLLSGMGGG